MQVNHKGKHSKRQKLSDKKFLNHEDSVETKHISVEILIWDLHCEPSNDRQE